MDDNKIRIPSPPIDEGKKRDSLEAVRREVSKKDLSAHISVPALMLDQIHYISMEYWIIQALFLAAAVLFLTCFQSLMQGSESILPVWDWLPFWNFQKAAPGIWQNWNRAAALTWDRYGP